jgi:hypothetical protein
MLAKLRLEMHIDGNTYDTASIRFKLEATDGRPTLQETPAIPVNALFDIPYLIGMSIRRTTMQYEKEVQEMAERTL